MKARMKRIEIYLSPDSPSDAQLIALWDRLSQEGRGRAQAAFRQALCSLFEQYPMSDSLAPARTPAKRGPAPTWKPTREEIRRAELPEALFNKETIRDRGPEPDAVHDPAPSEPVHRSPEPAPELPDPTPEPIAPRPIERPQPAPIRTPPVRPVPAAPRPAPAEAPVRSERPLPRMQEPAYPQPERTQDSPPKAGSRYRNLMKRNGE